MSKEFGHDANGTNPFFAVANKTVTRRTALAGIGALLATTAAACAAGGSSDDKNSSGGTVTLKFQSLAYQQETVAATAAIVEAWNKANPKIKVDLVQGSWDSVHDQLVTQFQGSSAPDIIHDESADMTGFAKQGFLADLTKYLDADVKSDVSADIWKTVTVDGKIIAAPTLLQSYVVFANSAMLSAGGVSAKGADLSWDDFATYSKKLTTGGNFGLGWGLKQPTASVMSLSLNYDGLFFKGGGKPTFSMGDNEKQVVKRMKDMMYVDKSIDPATITQGGSDILPGFYAGNYAMIVGGNYVAQQIKSDAPAGFKWEVLPPLKGTSTAQAANPQTLSVPAESKNIDKAAKFINFFMKAANLGAVGEGDWLIPTTKSAREFVATKTGGADGWTQTLAGADTLTEAPFQIADDYPQWKDQIATPALQEYFADKIDLAALTTKLSDGWKQVSK